VSRMVDRKSNPMQGKSALLHQRTILQPAGGPILLAKLPAAPAPQSQELPGVFDDSRSADSRAAARALVIAREVEQEAGEIRFVAVSILEWEADRFYGIPDKLAGLFC
jgi:hypothetical protein